LYGLIVEDDRAASKDILGDVADGYVDPDTIREIDKFLGIAMEEFKNQGVRSSDVSFWGIGVFFDISGVDPKKLGSWDTVKEWIAAG